MCGHHTEFSFRQTKSTMGRMTVGNPSSLFTLLIVDLESFSFKKIVFNLKILFIYLFVERGEGREKERKRN